MSIDPNFKKRMDKQRQIIALAWSEYFKRLRERNGLNKQQIAAVLHINAKRVDQIEKSQYIKNGPSSQIMCAISTAFDEPIDTILYEIADIINLIENQNSI